MMLVSVRSQGQLEGGHQLATSSLAARAPATMPATKRGSHSSVPPVNG
jgi:hypothetical protein